MSFDVDLGALSTFVATENEVRFAPSVFLIDPGNPVDCQRPRLWDRYLAELGGWRASHVKQNQASYHCKCECRWSEAQNCRYRHPSRLNSATVFSLIRVLETETERLSLAWLCSYRNR